MLYPMIFQPRYVDKIWGGRKLESILNKPIPKDKPIGESWELFDFPPGVVEGSKDWVSAVLTNGPHKGKTLHQLVGEFGKALHGDVKLVGTQGQFPILIKFLDAREDLSVQVHPPQSYADTHPGAHLKNEAWYVFQHDDKARILKGLVPGTTRAQFEESIKNGTCESKLQAIPVKDADCYYLPSGTVHALGAGVFAAEVQTPSDTTYRVFDFNRIEPATGKPRGLHIEQALDCIDFSGAEPASSTTHPSKSAFGATRLVQAPQFTIEKVELNAGAGKPIPYTQPVVWIMLSGTIEVHADDPNESVTVSTGTTILLPAQMKNPTVKATANATWLEVMFPTAA